MRNNLSSEENPVYKTLDVYMHNIRVVLIPPIIDQLSHSPPRVYPHTCRRSLETMQGYQLDAQDL